MTRRVLLWLAGLVVVATAVALLVWTFVGGRRELARERERELAVKVPPRISPSAGGEIVISLDGDTQTRIGLRTEALRSAALRPEVVAYGSLEADPAGLFTLRAPLAGRVAVASGRTWPSIGATVADGQLVGQLEPRVVPVERIDLAARLATARAEADALTAALVAARAAFERARTLNAEGKIVSDRNLQEAEARVRADDARLRALTETIRLLDASLQAQTGPTGSRPLLIARGGEVVEAPVQPGEAVESGQALLRLARFDRLMARVYLAAGQSVETTATRARIVVFGQEATPLEGTRVAFAATVDPTTRGQTVLFRVARASRPLRPGAAVTAYIPIPGPVQTGVIIPREALVRSEGRAWVYAQIGERRFRRQGVSLDAPTEDGWFATSGVAAGDRVVVAGAQTLLSEELKSQIEIGDEEDRGR
jgi:HlyD family secretion protein